MVDFNNETTISIAAIDIERVSILQRRYDVIEALEDYKKKRYGGAGAPLSYVRARLLSLFIELQAFLKRKLSEKEYGELQNTCFNSKDEMELVEALFTINEILDSVRLIRVDTQKTYDGTNVEEENKMKRF